ncbi:MAG: hypothetical protein QG574_2991 [Cyanobacteriota bacterium erpe_2018_sw_21hr_WHONDRS-SW48-000092_B_bin.40]|nr:hypothetical protein [Cyanobacteriota bacterium erpe_2018_sw_21hr_WHONDRS-SW48-000092_B_bin.40]
MDRETLQKLLAEDDLGLLSSKPHVSAEASSLERLEQSFHDITQFVKTHGREPAANKADIKEMMLHNRLAGLRQDKEKIALLSKFDELGLLGPVKQIDSIQSLLADDDLGILQDSSDDIFTLKNVPKPKEVENLPEYIAKRKPCKDFEKFEHLFKQVQSDLVLGIRKLSKFTKGTSVGAGQLFILRGMLVYVANEKKREDTPGADQGRMNDRLRCIFENGTESDMLRRSLSARLYELEGQRVSETASKLYETVNEITPEDQQTGFVYVLKSLSKKNEIRSLKHLYKIGFSRGPVEERIRNAAQEATYLMAPVSIVTSYQCYNFNPHKLESLLHAFFGSACLEVEVIDSRGQRCIPKEWFVAPLEIVNSAVELLIAGRISEFRYDEELQQIIPRRVQ